MSGSAILNNKIESVIYSIKKTAELAVKYGDESSMDKKLYEKLIFDVANVSSSAKIAEECIDCFKNLETVNEFEKKYAEKRNTSKSNVRASKQYKDLQQNISTILDNSSNNENCDDDYEMTTEICNIDPITKQKMIDPLKNKICGHRYEKNSILESISVNRRFRCPIIGCSNREFIKQSSLEEDLEFKMKLKRLPS